MARSYTMSGGNAARVLEPPIRLAPPLQTAWSETGVVLVDGDRQFFRTKKGHLAAWDIAHTKELWRFEKQRGGLGVLHEGALYWTVDGGFRVVDVESGTETARIRWSHGLHPLVIDRYWVGMEGIDEIRALDLRSGKPAWTYSANENLITAGLCASSGCIIACFSGALVVSLNQADGKEVWRADLTKVDPEGMVWGPRAFGNDLVLPVSDHHVVSLDLATGKRRWLWREDRASSAGAFACGDSYHLSADNGWYYEIDARTGKLVAKLDLGSALPAKLSGFWSWQPLLVSETHIFIGSSSGDLVAFDRKTGAYVWSHRAKRGDKILELVAIDGRLYYSDMGGHGYCMEPTSDAGAAGTLDAGEPGQDFDVVEVKKKQSVVSRHPCISPGGDFTVLRCRAGEATFFLAARSEKKGRGPFEWGEGYVWVPTVEDGECLLKAIREAFGRGRSKGKKGSRVKPPTPMGLAFLAEGVDEHGAGQGTWTHTKWTGEDGSPEFYVHWSFEEKRGVIIEKDESYRKDLIELFASLVVRP